MAADSDLAPVRATHPMPWVFITGAAVGVLGGMIGLGGAECRAFDSAERRERFDTDHEGKVPPTT